MNQAQDPYQDLRDAIRDLCAAFPAAYFREVDERRKFRETCRYQVAPISTNLILSYVAEHVLGLPRSF